MQCLLWRIQVKTEISWKAKELQIKNSNRLVKEPIKPHPKRILLKKTNSNGKLTETSTCKNENISPKNHIAVILIELVEIHGRGSHLNTTLASCKWYKLFVVISSLVNLIFAI